MKTIEEKAKEYYPKGIGYAGLFTPEGAEFLQKAYIRGATEQKSIDDKKYAKIRKLAMDMYTRASYLSTNGRPLRKAMFAFYRFINFEEKQED